MPARFCSNNRRYRPSELRSACSMFEAALVDLSAGPGSGKWLMFQPAEQPVLQDGSTAKNHPFIGNFRCYCDRNRGEVQFSRPESCWYLDSSRRRNVCYVTVVGTGYIP